MNKNILHIAKSEKSIKDSDPKIIFANPRYAYLRISMYLHRTRYTITKGKFFDNFFLKRERLAYDRKSSRSENLLYVIRRGRVTISLKLMRDPIGYRGSLSYFRRKYRNKEIYKIETTRYDI